MSLLLTITILAIVLIAWELFSSRFGSGLRRQLAIAALVCLVLPGWVTADDTDPAVEAESSSQPVPLAAEAPDVEGPTEVAGDAGPDATDTNTPAERVAVELEARAGAEDEPLMGADLGSPIYPENRPEWVVSKETAIWDGSILYEAVSTDPRATREISDRELDVRLKEATDRYINNYLGNSTAAMLLGYDLNFIKSQLVEKDSYYREEPLFALSGKMYEAHARLKFNDEFRHDLDERWRQVKATSRLAQTGLGAGAVLGLLALIFGFFKVDNRTRGFYTGRLRIATGVAILAMIASGVLLARWITWV